MIEQRRRSLEGGWVRGCDQVAWVWVSRWVAVLRHFPWHIVAGWALRDSGRHSSVDTWGPVAQLMV